MPSLAALLVPWLVQQAMLTSSVSSALLCTLFWSMQQPSRRSREEADQLSPPKQQQQGAVADSPSTVPSTPIAEPFGARATSAELMTDGQATGDTGLPTTGLAQGLLTDLLASDSAESEQTRAELLSPPASAELLSPPAVAEAPAAELEPGVSNDTQFKDPWAKQ